MWNPVWFLLLCCDKHHDQTNKQKTWWIKGLFDLHIPGNCLSLKNVRLGTQDRNLNAGTEAETVEECCFLAFSPVSCSATFLLPPSTTCPVVASPIVVDRALPHQSSTKKIDEATWIAGPWEGTDCLEADDTKDGGLPGTCFSDG